MISMESVGFQRAPSSDPQTITPGFAKDLLRFFARGGTLAPQEFLHILQQSAEQLAREPTVAFLPPPIGDAAPGDEGAPADQGRWVVVGDLHGSLGDLLYILESGAGPPSALNRLIFNGDFVDRGPHSVEVLASVLALKLAFPRFVHLNRGNHEDGDLNYAYDFARVVEEHFGGGDGGAVPEIMAAAADVFAALPLVGVVPRSCCEGAVVLHAGPPRVSRSGAVPEDSLACLARVERGRDRFRSVAAIRAAPGSGGDGGGDVDPALLVQDVLWSDPLPFDGRQGDLDDLVVGNEDRGGAGCMFSGGFARDFLRRSGGRQNGGHRHLVRSHQVVPLGVEQVALGESSSSEVLWTVFSASRYCGGFNAAACLALQMGAREPEVLAWDGAETDTDVDGDGVADDAAAMGLQERATNDVISVLWRNSNTLMECWEERGVPASPYIGVADWAEVLSEVVGMRTEVWETLLPLLGGTVAAKPHLVNFRQQARLVEKEYRRAQQQGQAASLPPDSITGSALYSDAKAFKAMFDLLDDNSDGVVDFEELERIVDVLNNEDGADEALELSARVIWSLLDMNRDNFVSLNEFAERNRHLHK